MKNRAHSKLYQGKSCGYILEFKVFFGNFAFALAYLVGLTSCMSSIYGD